ncbi:hypothetical protein [Streptomyces sp. NPDC046261]|uniref:hypothetical protein n=1 Tax=Streptomyces sp. NPDC046261 TaxID=3157200 RepID=UPI0034050FD3
MISLHVRRLPPDPRTSLPDMAEQAGHDPAALGGRHGEACGEAEGRKRMTPATTAAEQP